ncbi:hypothetical protein TTHERM_01150380 (macronuclear) [Tetrahymena thermophila SB210]|uniref:Uncharacterized protein n=1 Tax=Tetrahymena thermophila (strain SB210) TaxID=312017 RepID=Q23ZA3_TETTS|nr:hypothetical protein TTHERM_01150380 [Tetrahymena thermophila SB210]EAS01868.1 hypothetical protein TTHERM_01150380 [Tetrahymena thermophila SB210]|eukprot:XP_001022113.1 hypothetical protein TTHERM_01150380 [Tetrahymena thermophila SB210]
MSGQNKEAKIIQIGQKYASKGMINYFGSNKKARVINPAASTTKNTNLFKFNLYYMKHSNLLFY